MKDLKISYAVVIDLKQNSSIDLNAIKKILDDKGFTSKNGSSVFYSNSNMVETIARITEMMKDLSSFKDDVDEIRMLQIMNNDSLSPIVNVLV